MAVATKNGHSTDEATPQVEARPMSAAEWRKASREGELFQFPSGAVARLKRPSLMHLAVGAGSIPSHWAAELLSWLTNRPNRTQTQDDPAAATEEYKRNERVIDYICELAFVEPRFRAEGDPGPNDLTPEDVSDTDKVWLVYTFVEGRADELAPFRWPKPEPADETTEPARTGASRLPRAQVRR